MLQNGGFGLQTPYFALTWSFVGGLEGLGFGSIERSAFKAHKVGSALTILVPPKLHKIDMSNGIFNRTRQTHSGATFV